MPERQIDVAVIVVNYDSAELAIASVDSVLKRRHGGRRVHIFVVDNGSQEADREILSQQMEDAAWEKHVTVFLEDENHGFGKANNKVFELLKYWDSRPKYVYLLNPDAELQNEAIKILSDSLDRNPGAFAAGSALEQPDGTPASACFRFPKIHRELLTAINFGALLRAFPGSSIHMPADQTEGQVDWVSGASVMFRFSSLIDIGFFDPDFFLYYEEVELMHRASEMGYSTLYAPKARATHRAGSSTKVPSTTSHKRRPRYLYESWRMYHEKTGGHLYAIFAAILKVPASWIGTGLAVVRRRDDPTPKLFTTDHTRYVILPLFGINR